MVKKIPNLRKYKIFMCKHCGTVQVSMAIRTLKCVSCGKSSVMKGERDYGLSLVYYGSFDHPMDATRVCQEVKKRLAVKKDVL